MTSRALMYLGMTVALAACSKNSQEADALSPPPRDTVRMAQPTNRKPGSDTTRTNMARPDTSQYGKDSTRMKTDTTGSR